MSAIESNIFFSYLIKFRNYSCSLLNMFAGKMPDGTVCRRCVVMVGAVRIVAPDLEVVIVDADHAVGVAIDNVDGSGMGVF